MIGNNELHFNQATMIVAVQQYLNSEMTSPPRVLSVEKEGGNYTTTFVVKVDGGETPQPKTTGDHS